MTSISGVNPASSWFSAQTRGTAGPAAPTDGAGEAEKAAEARRAAWANLTRPGVRDDDWEKQQANAGRMAEMLFKAQELAQKMQRETSGGLGAAVGAPDSGTGVATGATIGAETGAATGVVSTAAAGSSVESATATFMAYMEKTPAEQYREAFLADKGLTEESLARLPIEERLKIEEEIRQMLKEKLSQPKLEV